MSERIFDLIVVGGGIGGGAAALRAVQYHLDLAWIVGSKETARSSRVEYVQNIDNMIGVHPDILLRQVERELAGEAFAAARAKLEQTTFHIGTRAIADNARERVCAEVGPEALIVEDKAESAEREGELFAVGTGDGRRLLARNLILSTGVEDRQPSIKKTLKSGKVVDDMRWVFPYANHERLLYCIRCEGHLPGGKPTAVIGHGEEAAQIAMMMHERYGEGVVLLTNGEEPAVSDETRRLLEAYGIAVHGARMVDIFDAPPEERTGPKGSDLHGFVLEDGTRIEVRYALVALGLHRVFNALARQLVAELELGDADERRHVLIEDHSSETSVRGLFAVGDMARRRDGGPSMKQIYTAQEFAVRAVDTIDRRKRSARRRALLTGD